MKPISEIRDAFLRVHYHTTGLDPHSYMSVPLRGDEADIILMDAIDELERLRFENNAYREYADLQDERLAHARGWARLWKVVASCWRASMLRGRGMQ
jgi:hypothetical protein